MNIRTLTYIIVLCLIALALLLARGIALPFGSASPHRYFALNDVRGSEVIHADQPYTLNFEQQTAVIELLNRAIVVGRVRSEALEPPNFQKLVIYLFAKDPIELVPVDIVNGNIIFSAPALQKGGYIQDTSQGDLLSILSKSYDN